MECSSLHRNLHSVPTRRSSDLEKFEQRAKNVYAADQELAKKFINTVRAAQEAWLIFRDRRDRKSTRLNSSHVAISYAVHCLKKDRPGRREWTTLWRSLGRKAGR